MSQRQFEGQLKKAITVQDLSQLGGVDVADPAKLELEMREIFENIERGDPTLGSAVKNGNMRGPTIPFTTPSAVDTEVAVQHNLGYIPRGIDVVIPVLAGGSHVGSLYVLRAADETYLYLAVRAAADVSRLTAVEVW